MDLGGPISQVIYDLSFFVLLSFSAFFQSFLRWFAKISNATFGNKRLAPLWLLILPNILCNNALYCILYIVYCVNKMSLIVTSNWVLIEFSNIKHTKITFCWNKHICPIILRYFDVLNYTQSANNNFKSSTKGIIKRHIKCIENELASVALYYFVPDNVCIFRIYSIYLFWLWKIIETSKYFNGILRTFIIVQQGW